MPRERRITLMARNPPICLGAVLLLAGCGVGKANPAAVQQRLTTDIPLHSTPTQVLAYLNTQKIAHSPYHRTENTGMSIEAEMAIPTPHSFVQPTYDVVFRFDDNNLLKSYDIQYLGYIGL
jgi:hypothetical protein